MAAVWVFSAGGCELFSTTEASATLGFRLREFKTFFGAAAAGRVVVGAETAGDDGITGDGAVVFTDGLILIIREVLVEILLMRPV